MREQDIDGLVVTDSTSFYYFSGQRAPAWMKDYILFTNDPDEVIAFYRDKLQVL